MMEKNDVWALLIICILTIVPVLVLKVLEWRRGPPRRRSERDPKDL